MPTPSPAPKPIARLLSSPSEESEPLLVTAVVSARAVELAVVDGGLDDCVDDGSIVLEGPEANDKDDRVVSATSLTGSRVKKRSELSSQSQLSSPRQQKPRVPQVLTPEWLTIGRFRINMFRMKTGGD
jgi:hypothetical protein